MRCALLGRYRAGSSAGFMYVALLFVVAVIGIGLAAAAQIWHTNSKREKEAELLFIGDEFRRALASYAASSPGAPRYPASLDQLVRDDRFPQVRRHLRRIYRDPLTGTTEWGLVPSPLGIIGVYSLSDESPLKQGGFPTPYESFATAATYQDWKFVYTVVATPNTPSASPGASTVAGGGIPSATAGVGQQSRAIDAQNQFSQLDPCDAQRAEEARSCADAGKRAGAEATSRCIRSVAARLAACKRGLTMPPLQLPDQ